MKSDHYFLLHINDGCYFMKREMPEGLLLLSSFMNDGKSRPVYIKYNLFWYECKWPNFKKNIYNFCNRCMYLGKQPLLEILHWTATAPLSALPLPTAQPRMSHFTIPFLYFTIFLYKNIFLHV